MKVGVAESNSDIATRESRVSCTSRNQVPLDFWGTDALVTGELMRNLRRLLAALAIFAMLVGGISVAAALIFSDHSKPAALPTATPRTTPPPPSVPTVKEFTIKVVVTEQNCDPRPGCVYKYTIEPKYIGFHPLPTTPFTVKYEVQGGNRPQPGEFTVEGSQAKIFKDVVLEGPPAAQLQAVVLQVVG